MWCRWHLILALAKYLCQGEHEIRRSGVPPTRPADNGVVGDLNEVTARASRAIGPSAAILAALLSPDLATEEEGGAAIP
jgi:hypothetical protein